MRVLPRHTVTSLFDYRPYSNTAGTPRRVQRVSRILHFWLLHTTTTNKYTKNLRWYVYTCGGDAFRGPFSSAAASKVGMYVWNRCMSTAGTFDIMPWMENMSFKIQSPIALANQNSVLAYSDVWSKRIESVWFHLEPHQQPKLDASAPYSSKCKR